MARFQISRILDFGPIRLGLRDRLNWHRQVGGLILGCEEPVCHCVFAFDTPVLP